MPYEYRVADAEGLIHVTAWGQAHLVETVVLQAFTDHGEAVAWARTQAPRGSHGQEA